MQNIIKINLLKLKKNISQTFWSNKKHSFKQFIGLGLQNQIKIYDHHQMKKINRVIFRQTVGTDF